MTRFLGLIFMLTCGLWQFAYAKNPRIYDDDPTKTSKTMVTLSSGDTTIIVCGTSISLTATGGTTYSWSEGSTPNSATNTITGTANQQKIVSVQVTSGTTTRLDSIMLTFISPSPLAAPTQSGTVQRCGAGPVTFTANIASPATYAIWYADNTTTTALSQGTTFTTNAPATPTNFSVYASAASGGQYSVGPANYSPANNTTSSAVMGVKFKAMNQIVLNTVHVSPSVSNFQVKVSLLSGTSVLMEKSFSFTSQQVGGKVPLDLNWVINAGSNYELRYTSTSACYVTTAGTTYPYKIPGAIHLTGANASNPAYFPYFYDWKVTLLGCESSRTQFNATIKSAPQVFPYAVVSCAGSATLNAIAGTGAANPTGTTYAWISGTGTSVGTTETINVSAPINNPYRVIATLPSTGCKDTAYANVYLPSGSGTISAGQGASRCGPGTVQLSLTGNSSQYIWYDAAAGGNMVGSGTAFTTASLSSTTSFFAATVNGSTDALGITSTTSLAGVVTPPLSTTPNNQGLVFDVLVPMMIQNVAVTSKIASTSANPSIFEISLYDNTGSLLQTTPFTINNFLAGSSVVLPLNFPVNPGTGYRLLCKSVSNTNLYYTTMSSGGAVPYGTNTSLTLPGVAQITGGASSLIANNNNAYYYFYDWDVYVIGCPSNPRTVITATVNPQPILSLPSISIACGGSITLNAGVTNPTAGTGLTYLWTPGNSNQASITVSNAGSYTVSSYFSNAQSCASTATTNVISSTSPTGTVTTGGNISRCNTGSVTLTATGGTGTKMLWFQNLTAPTPPATDDIVGVGNNFTFNATSNVTYYATSVNGVQNNTGALNPGIGTAPYGSASQGLKFDVSIPVVLEQVSVYFKNLGSTIFKIQLKNAANQLVTEKLFNLNVSSINTEVVLDLDFPINPGTDYKLTYLSLLGGNQLSYNTSGSVFPYTLPNILKIKSSTNTSSATTTNFYYYFYKWKVFIPGCSISPRKPVSVTINSFTIPSLPAYVDTCATSYLLKPYATAPTGYTYLWSPSNATTATYNATSAGTYSVIVTDPATSCKDTVSSIVAFSNSPLTPTANDISKCGGGVITLTASSAGADKLLWYNVGNSIIQKTGNSYTVNLYASANFLVSAANGASNVAVGKPDNTGQTSNTSTSSSMNFNVSKSIIIESVKVYLVSPGSLKVRLLNAQSLVLQEKIFDFPNTAGLQTLALDFGVAPGNGYKLQFTSIGGTKLVFNTTNLAFPYTLSGIMSITGTSQAASNFNGVFYDWRVFVVGCESAKKQVAVNILPVPTLTNPVVLPVCASNTTLSANSTAQSNVTYSWSPGNTTGLTLPVTSSGNYQVIANYSASAGGCSDTATTAVTLFTQTLSTPTAPAVSRCGTGPIDVVATAPNSNLILWYNSNVSDSIIGIGGTYTYNATTAPSTTTLYTSAAFGSTVHLGPLDETFGTSFYGTAPEGVRFTVSQDVILQSVNIIPLYPDPQFKIELYDIPAQPNPNNPTIAKYSKIFALNNVSGLTEVQLGFFVDFVPGPGIIEKEYVLKYTPILNGAVAATSSNVNYNNYVQQGVARMKGAISQSNSSNYFFMYDWKLYVVGCTSPRTAVTVQAKQVPDVNLPPTYNNCSNTGNTVSIAPNNPANPTGTTYSWTGPNNGNTNFLVNVNTSGLYTATATYQGCAYTETMVAYIGNTPSAPTAQSPQTFCGIGNYDLVASPPSGALANNLVWYTSNPTSNPQATPVGIGSPYNVYLDTPSVTYYVLASAGARTKTGEIDINANGTKAASTTNTGIKFDILQGLFIDSIAVYPVGFKLRFNLKVYDKNNNLVYSQYVNKSGLSPGLKTWIKLGLYLNPDVDYRIMYEHITGLSGNNGCYVKTSGFSFPYTLNPSSPNTLLSLKSNTLSSIYSYFFDWRVYVPACKGTAIPILAKVNSAVQVDIDGTDDGQMFSCNSINIQSIIPAPAGGVTYSWYSNGSPTTPIGTSVNYNVTSPNTYWVIATENGCTASDTVTVNISQDLGLADDGILCSNQLVTNYGTNPTGGVTFAWSTGATTPSITVSQPGTYFVQVQDPSGCPLADTVVVTGFDVPPVSYLPEVASGCPSVTLDPQVPGGLMAYSWSTGAASDTLIASATGTYWVQVTNANGCFVYDTTNFELTTPPTPVIGSPLVNGNTLSFNNTNVGGWTYSWNFGATANPPTTTTPNPTPVSTTFPGTGFYNVTLCASDPSGVCPIVSCSSTQVMVSVEDGFTPEKRFNVYPNPTQVELFIDANVSRKQTVQATLLDLNGRQIRSQSFEAEPNSKQRLDVSNLTRGIYLLKVNADGYEEVFKIMID